MSYQNSLPETGYLRIRQIVGDKKSNPPLPPIIPVGRSSWWDGVKKGKFPKPIKISKRTTAGKVEDIRALIEKYSNQ